MNEEKYIRRVSLLIVKKLRQDLTEQEAEELEIWRKSSEGCERLYQKLLVQHDFSVDYRRYKQLETGDDWQKILHRAKAGSSRSWSLVFKYAAVIFLIFSAGVYLLRWQKADNDWSPVVVQTEIVPGSPKAILELAGGRRIYLDKQSEKSGQLLGQYGITEEDSLLSYQSSGAAYTNEYHTLVVPRGGEFILALEDGTKIWVNAESVLKYPVCFANDHRKVYLLEGEAYFRVARDISRPFYVEASGMSVRVTGTEFNVMAYKNKENVETTLAKGVVSISAGDYTTNLLPGDQAVFSKSKGELTKKEVNVPYYTSWKEGVFEFQDMPLQEVAELLGRWYDVDFFFLNEKMKNIRFTGAVQKTKSLEFILNIIRETRAVNYQIKGKTITIYN